MITFAFGPDKSRAERSRDFVSNHDPANRRRRHELNSLASILLRNRASEAFCTLRKLKHERTLQIDRAVQTTRQLKMTFQQRAGSSELIDHLFSVQFLTSLCMYCLLYTSDAADER